MSDTREIRVGPLPPWIELRRLLGPGSWTLDQSIAHAHLSLLAAADVAARLRGLVLDGQPVLVEAVLPRAGVRAARTAEARRHRDTTPSFRHIGARVDPADRALVTPEDLAVALGRRIGARQVLDLGCGPGGNAIGFARARASVTAVDHSWSRLETARHNAAVYGVQDRIRFVCADAYEVLDREGAEVLFVDPPWEDLARTPCGCRDLPLLEAAVQAVTTSDRFGELLAKVPPSFDTHTIPGASARAWFGTAPGDHRRIKFLTVHLRVTRRLGGGDGA